MGGAHRAAAVGMRQSDYRGRSSPGPTAARSSSDCPASRKRKRRTPGAVRDIGENVALSPGSAAAPPVPGGGGGGGVGGGKEDALSRDVYSVANEFLEGVSPTRKRGHSRRRLDACELENQMTVRFGRMSGAPTRQGVGDSLLEDSLFPPPSRIVVCVQSCDAHFDFIAAGSVPRSRVGLNDRGRSSRHAGVLVPLSSNSVP